MDFADRIVYSLNIPSIQRPDGAVILNGSIARLGLNRERIDQIRQTVVDELEGACESIGVSFSDRSDAPAREEFKKKSHAAVKKLRDESIRLDRRRSQLAEKVDELTQINDLMGQLEACSDLEGALRLIATSALRGIDAREVICWIDRGQQLHLAATATLGKDVVLEEVDEKIEGWKRRSELSERKDVLAKEIQLRNGRAGGIRIVGNSGGDRSGSSTRKILDLTARVAGLVIDRISGMEEQRRRADQLGRMHTMLSEAHGRLQTMHEELVQQARLQTIGKVASGVAHDFNNILASVMGQVQLALHRSPSKEIARDLAVIEQASLSGAELVKRIQDLARVGAARNDQQVVTLRNLAEGAAELTRHRWAKKASENETIYEVSVELGKDVAVKVNPDELKQALVNLILNGLDAMPNGGELRISGGSTGDTAWICVRDDGDGIPYQNRDSVFDPFFTTKGRRGSGLGLSIVEGIVKRHQGEIDVQSASGWGTIVLIDLPLSDEKAAVRDVVEQDRTEVKPQPILVVEDEEPIREMMVEALSMDGHRVSSVASGEAAVKALSGSDYSVLLTDLAMPRMSGWELAEKASKRNPSTKIVLVTGWGEEIKEEERLARGVHQVISKPFRLRELRTAVGARSRQ